MKRETNLAIPHQALLNELQIGLLAIAGQRPLVSSTFKWIQSTLEKKGDGYRLGWVMAREDHIGRFITLKDSVYSLDTPLQSLMSHIKEFSTFQAIQCALYAFEKTYKALPSIESEIHRLSLGQNLFENSALLPPFLAYIEHVAKLEEHGHQLKQLLVEETLQHLSLSLSPRLPL